MDEARAKRLTEELVGKSVGGWHVIAFAGAGKSAIVFKAKRGDSVAAIKVFDPELIDPCSCRGQVVFPLPHSGGRGGEKRAQTWSIINRHGYK